MECARAPDFFASNRLGRTALAGQYLNVEGYDGAATEPRRHYSYTRNDPVGLALVSLMLRMPLYGLVFN